MAMLTHRVLAGFGAAVLTTSGVTGVLKTGAEAATKAPTATIHGQLRTETPAHVAAVKCDGRAGCRLPSASRHP